MEIIVNSCKKFLLMVVKENIPYKTNVFEGCDAKRQADLEKVVSEYDILFQEPIRLPPKSKLYMILTCNKMLHCLTLEYIGYPL